MIHPRFPHLDTIFLRMHCPLMTLKFRVPKRDNVPGPDLVKLLDGRVGEVGVDERAVGAIPNRGKRRREVVAEDVGDEGLWGAVGYGGFFLGGDGLSDEGAEVGARFLELVLAEAGGWGFVVLFKGSFAGFAGVVVYRDVGLGVVGVEDVDYSGDVLAAASAGGVCVFDFVDDVLSGLERWRWHVGLCPPLRLSVEIDLAGNRPMFT